jgi:predicted XRE-type DNA-binding protein
MGEQLHRRLPQTFVPEILEAFSQHQLSEVQACELLGLKRTRLYELERRYLQACLKGSR